MAWLVGIDEAGYGPNLGPLVMTAVACRVPDAAADLWCLLADGVRRHGERDDGRILVADSKLVYSTTRGLLHLEKGVLAALHQSGRLTSAAPLFLDLEPLLTGLCPEALTDLAAESWYSGSSALPLECETALLHEATDRLRAACLAAKVTLTVCRSVVVCTPRFNELTDTCDSKAATLRFGLIALLRTCLAAMPAERTLVVIDKHGGRNSYGAMLREALPDGWVRKREEGMECSVYDVARLDRAVRITITPRADQASFAVALASMISKYLREALMREFNAFWQRHVPGLVSTAGYPGDAGRFYGEIRGAAQRLGLSERQVWRRK